ncbi:MAG TPA: hypothetical protein VHC22_24935 [Pirellulales bacterium]|nr:hypothetical protein [Pirellulales bacterium]
MRLMQTFVAGVAVLAGLSFAVAAELKSGKQPGDAIGPFDVVKCAGSEDDDVKLGAELCYRCKYGNRPMVMVFARKSDASVSGLVKKLDGAVEKNSDEKLAAFVNLVGEDKDALETNAKELGKKAKAPNVPIVVPVEYENGPADYGINPAAEVTVILAVKGKVVANHAYGPGQLNEKAVDKILSDVPKILQ